MFLVLATDGVVLLLLRLGRPTLRTISICVLRDIKNESRAIYNDENQPERLETGAPWGLYPGTGVPWPVSAADVRRFLRRVYPVPPHDVKSPKYTFFRLIPF